MAAVRGPDASHPWELEGRCYYCVPCNVRVGQALMLQDAVAQGLLPAWAFTFERARS